MIPKNIRKEHILKAIKEIDRSGTPSARKSRKFYLIYKGKPYPVKYVISLANKYANGEELEHTKFSGGKEANGFLGKLGFKVVESIAEDFHRHDERCSKCKKTVEAMLRNIYGRVLRNYRFELGTKPDDYRDYHFYKDIVVIFRILQNYRNHKDFVKEPKLPPCDFFLPEAGFIVEFDESQHFTFCRKLSLLEYPENLVVGFCLKKWINLCEVIDAKDNDPPYRDEQRAWYDTIRDFLPTTEGLKPTRRLFSRDFQWCSMNPENPYHLKIFKAILEGKEPWWKIRVRKEQNPWIARIIIHSPDWYGYPETAKQILTEICRRWPKDIRVKFIITGGGFLQFNWPNNIGKKEIGDNLNPNPTSFGALLKGAERCVRTVIDDQLCLKLRKLSNYITLGVDSFKFGASTTKNYMSELHVEFVCLVDLINKRFHLTGKSYPTPREQRRLVRMTDLKSHFIELGDGKVMVLGCHDLTIFNPRSDAVASGWRKRLKEEFKRVAIEEDPTIVLHHPHTTDCINVWGQALGGLERVLNNLEIYAGAGRWPHTIYHSYKDGGIHCTFEDVREKTKRGNSIDFIVMRTFHV